MSSGAGFAMLVPARPGARVLEVSAGNELAAETLRCAGCLVTCIRADEDLARTRGPFDVALLSLALGRTRGSERIVGDLRSIARAAAQLLVPGGRLIVCFPNPLYSLPLLAPLIERLLGDDAGTAPRGPLLPRAASAAGLCRSFEDEGLTAVEAFAALPGIRRIKFLVSLDGTAAAELFFRALVPRSRHAPRRAAAHLAAIAAAHGMLALCAPGFCVVGSKAGAR